VPRGLDGRFAQRHAGAHDQPPCTRQPTDIERPQVHRYIRPVLAQSAQPGRIIAAIDDLERFTRARQEAGAGQARLAQADDHRRLLLAGA